MAVELQSVSGAPGGLPLLGHGLPQWRKSISFVKSLSNVGDLVRVALGSLPVYFATSPELIHELLVSKAHSFEKGRVFDRLGILLGDGLKS